ncbi:MAG: DEAD/DEAH box helicase [Candidatus Hodarchaeales archaeon]
MIELEDLRTWQSEAYLKWVNNGGTGIYLGCTGSGKSIAAMYCIQEKNVPTIIIVPTIALMNQWTDEIKKHLNYTPGQMGDGKRELKRITVAVINSVRTMDLNMFDMIVCDEAHRYGSFENIQPIMQDFKYKLGVTATLKRSDGQDKVLEELLGSVCYTYSTEDAVKDGVLSKFEIINVAVNLTKEEKEEYDKHTKTIDKNSFPGMFQAINEQGHPKWQQAIQAVRATSWRKAVISNAKEKMNALLEIVKAEDGKKIIIFNETIKMAELEKRLLRKAGYASEVYHSKSKNQQSIEKFRSGEVKILVSVKSLNEGLDVKDVDVGIRVAGTSQDRDTIQRLGRGLRVVEGKEGAKYYQLYCDDTLEKWQIIKNTNVIKSAAEGVRWRKLD